jgi:multidrug efflux system outer membrane protein
MTAIPRPILRCLVTGALGALALAGCAVGPDYKLPSANPPPQWRYAGQWKPAQPNDAALKENWWEVFDDPVLNGLEIQARTNSPQIQAAFARVEQARAVARVSRADLFPNLSANPSWNRERFSLNRPVQPTSVNSTISYNVNDFNVPFDASYEVDLWGRVRRSFHSARAQAQASAAAYQNLMLSLQADLAQTYFTIRSVDLERRVVGETVELRRKNLELVQSLHAGGADSAIDVARAQTELASAQADLIGLKLRRDQLESAVGVLCGEPPVRFSIAESTRRYRPPTIPSALPSELLERRPDIAQAERAMASASEQIGVAKAAFFPAIRLTGSAGVESADLHTLFDWETRQWAFGPSLSLPIFEGGRNKANLERSKAAYDEAVANYRQQVLAAFQEVDLNLNGLILLKQQFEAAIQAVDASQIAADLSRARYKEGLASYFEVVDAERTLLENEILAYELNGTRMVTSVLLIKTLGGGWRPDAVHVRGSVAAKAH